MTDEATVEITLGDDVFILRPKLSAMKAVNRMSGGYAGAFRALQNFDVDACVTIVAAGTGATGRAALDIEKRIYTHGVDKLLQPLVRFVNICAAGGRDPDTIAPKDEDGSDAKN